MKVRNTKIVAFSVCMLSASILLLSCLHRPPRVTDFHEEEFSGEITVFEADRDKSRRYELRTKGERSTETATIYVSFADLERVNHLESGDWVDVSGVLRGNMLHEAHLWPRLPQGSVTTGPYRTIVLITQSANRTPRCSNATMNSAVFTAANSVSAYYAENSYGLVSVSGDVTGPYTIDVGDKCSRGKWADQADAKATAAGVNLGAYDNRLYVDPAEGDSLCSAGGLSDDGSPTATPLPGKGRMWVSNKVCDSPHYLVHELGHLFGENHASTGVDEYGDASSVMGGNSDFPENADLIPTSPHFNAPGKISVGWLPASRVQTVTKRGRYRVAFLASASVGIQALKIQKAAGKGDYYLSYRRAVGFDATLRPAYLDKTSVHSWNGRTSAKTFLVGTLGDGQSWTDGHVTVSQTTHDATYAYLTVSFP